jgi:uncharacterized membrane protein
MRMALVTYAKLYGIALALFLALDLTWLGVVAKGFYAQQVGFMMRERVLWPAALLFYALFVLGLLVFVIGPAFEARSVMKALALGAFFGFITYQTYDLTNYAIVKGWPLPLVVVDIAWGTVLAGAVSTGTVWIGKKLLAAM